MLTFDSPEAVGLDIDRWEAACRLARDWCQRDVIPSLALIVGRGDIATKPRFFGRQRLDVDSAPLGDDAIFLIASITKPIVATGAMLLIERGLLTLGDRVHEVIPEFAGKGRYAITIRHLLTHTSGLPDMLPNNVPLREAHAPLSEFVAGTCGVQPSFRAGRSVQYQSMGFAVLGEIVARISGVSCAEFLQREIFGPLEMNDMALGAPSDWFSGAEPRISRVPEIRPPAGQDPNSDWGWNSPYWQRLGAPWGGLLTTPADLARFAQMMLNNGKVGTTTQLLGRATVRAATRNQLCEMADVPEVDRRCKPWGLGWRLHWPTHSANFGDLLGPRTYGHWGATGTVLWIDPELDAFAIILSTQPQEPHGKQLARLSNALASAIR